MKRGMRDHQRGAPAFDALHEGRRCAPPSANFQTGMPSLRALSHRLSVTPLPGKAMTP